MIWEGSIREIRRIEKFSSRSLLRKFARGEKDADSLPIDLQGFSEISHGGGTSINKEFRGKKPYGRALSF